MRSAIFWCATTSSKDAPSTISSLPLARPLGNFDDCEFSSSRALSMAVQLTTNTRASSDCVWP